MPDSQPRSGALVMRARMCCNAPVLLLTVRSNRLLYGLQGPDRRYVSPSWGRMKTYSVHEGGVTGFILTGPEHDI